MIRTAAAAAFIAVTLGPPTANAFGGSWQCEKQADADKDEAWKIASNIGMFRVVSAYRERWDAQYAREQCEAFDEGRPYDISCLNDRRDWDAIRQSIPSELFGKSNSDLRPYYLELQISNNGYKGAIEYCRSVGAIK